MEDVISFVLRTYNESEFLGNLLDAIGRQQNIGKKIEIILVDSGSTDGTVSIASSRGVNVIEIPHSEFNYSTSLNLGVGKCKGDLIVILSAHSIPIQSDWLARIASHFDETAVAGVYCRQIPHNGATPMEVFRVEEMFEMQSRTFDLCTPCRALTFSNAASCIRRSVWEKHPFVVLPAAEDKEWADWVIENGYKIIYDAQATVYHSHNENYRQGVRRKINIEKAADIRLMRRRSILLTMRQAIGCFFHTLVDVSHSKHFKGQRMRYIKECFLSSIIYVIDFHRSG